MSVVIVLLAVLALAALAFAVVAYLQKPDAGTTPGKTPGTTPGTVPAVPSDGWVAEGTWSNGHSATPAIPGITSLVAAKAYSLSKGYKVFVWDSNTHIGYFGGPLSGNGVKAATVQVVHRHA